MSGDTRLKSIGASGQNWGMLNLIKRLKQRRLIMFTRLKNSMFGRKNVSEYRNKKNPHLESLARIEYGKEWEYAYDFMLRTGKMPATSGSVVK